ncbi:hypothetical protein ABFV47_25125 [Mycolicibacterium fortuitum]|uniref:hypothetical protein n=1 Tax=Mycolicibacterium TaxID=1866885 RepID=UPI00320476DF
MADDYSIEIRITSKHHPEQLALQGQRNDWPALLLKAQKLARQRWQDTLTVRDDGYPLATLQRPGDPPGSSSFGEERQYAYCSAYRAGD